MGLLNYILLRWAPKNRVGRLIFEMTFLIGFFLILALLARLSQG
jgi:hypothetical protein